MLTCQRGADTMKKSSLEFVKQLDADRVIGQLKEIYGNNAFNRIEVGVKQVARLWRMDDGTPEEFAQFCEDQFISDSTILQETADRFERNLEQIDGLNTILTRELQRQIHLDIGMLHPVDMLFAEFDPFAHLNEDFFRTKLAFAALLNFPLYTLEERLKFGEIWSRREWAQARLVQRFSERVPAAVQQRMTAALVEADHYISNYNIHMHQLITAEGERLFPEGLKLISHWGLRDELKAQYANPDGLKRQRMIQQVMERIIRQEIPTIMVDKTIADWDPYRNHIQATALKTERSGISIDASPEKDTRYVHLLQIFRAIRQADPYYPDTPTLMDRRFKRNREIPETEFESLLISILQAPVAGQVAALIRQRLGRELETFDIWYDGFKVRSQLDMAELDAMVAERYPSALAFQSELPSIFRKLGFSKENASFLASKIIVDPSRGVGHAAGAGLRSDNAHLRTRVADGGMNYKGFNIAIHELGHNVEQVFSLNRIDHTLLQGVPNTAFTECFAFVFQSRDLELLGMNKNDPFAEHLNALDTFWSTFEISGVALVDMHVWHWMYEHPDATASELKKAVQMIAKDVWNQYFTPVLGIKDQPLLAIYSHMIDAALYLPDYPLGHIISFQIEEYLKSKNLASEMERMCRIGSVTPSAWMQTAIGEPISTRPLIDAAEKAVTIFSN